jgi:hypothetical protein
LRLRVFARTLFQWLSHALLPQDFSREDA